MPDVEKYEIRRGEFGWALEEMKRGRKLRRREWDEGIYWMLVDGRFILAVDVSGPFPASAVKVDDAISIDWEHHD